MRLLSSLRALLNFMFRRQHVEHEMEEELRSHIQDRADDLERQGLARAEAERQARIEFGGFERYKEECREALGTRLPQELIADLRYGLRQLRRNRGFTAVAIITLALGIGANTAIFSLLDGLVLRDLPAPHPEQLVLVGADVQGYPYQDLSVPLFQEIARNQKVFSRMFAWSGDALVNVETDGVLSRADLWFAGGNYYSELGATPEIGRLIGPEDASLNAAVPAQVAVLSYSFWQRHYGGKRDVIGKALKIETVPFTIIGVTPRGFAGMNAQGIAEVTVPLTAEPIVFGESEWRKHLDRVGALWIDAAGRLKRGVTIQQARAQFELLWPAIQRSLAPDLQTPAERAYFLSLRLRIESGAKGISFVRGRFARPLLVLLAISGAILLIACVNLAGLMVSRTAARSHEMGVRIALGAGRLRLARQVLTEAIMLAIGGTLVAFAFAEWGSYALANFILGQTYAVPGAVNLSLDWQVLGFTGCMAITTTILFGLAPAWRAAREDPNQALQQSSRTAGKRTGKLGKGLIVTQVALSLVLLAAAGLFIRSLEKLGQVQPGFRTRGLVDASLYPEPDGYKSLHRIAYYRELTERVSNLPGVTSAGIAHMHLGGAPGWRETIHIQGRNSADVRTDLALVMPGFFRTVGIHLLQGRPFNWEDNGHAPHVAIVSENFAQKFFPAGNAIGQRMKIVTEPKWKSVQIVGIATNASLYDIRQHWPLTVYIASTQYGGYMGWSELYVRTNVSRAAIAKEIRRAVTSLSHEYVPWIRTVSGDIGRSFLGQRLTAMFSAFFGALAILLTAIGLYSLMAYSVARRTHEIGIRMALGAQKSDVLRLVVGQGMILTLVGVGIGIIGALGLTRFLSSLLYGVKPTDPLTFVVVSLILTAVALLACYIPARRAMKIDPMEALRYE